MFSIIDNKVSSSRFSTTKSLPFKISPYLFRNTNAQGQVKTNNQLQYFHYELKKISKHVRYVGHIFKPGNTGIPASYLTRHSPGRSHTKRTPIIQYYEHMWVNVNLQFTDLHIRLSVQKHSILK